MCGRANSRRWCCAARRMVPFFFCFPWKNDRPMLSLHPVVVRGHLGYIVGYHKWTDVVYRGYLGHIPGFRVYVQYVGCKTELLSSAGNVAHSTSLTFLLFISFSDSFSRNNLCLLNLCRRALRVVDSLGSYSVAGLELSLVNRVIP